MNAKEARKIASKNDEETWSQFGDRRQAMGFLDCYEQVKPMVEALQKIKLCRDWFRAKDIANQAISRFRKQMEE